MEKRLQINSFIRQNIRLENSSCYTKCRKKRCRKKKIFDKIVSRQGNPEDFVYDDMEEEIECGQIYQNAEIDLTKYVLVFY